MDKRFQSILEVPEVWESLLGIQSLDDLSSFLEPAPPPQALMAGGLTRADWSKPFRNDRREVSFSEDDYVVALELLSGRENYFIVSTITLPNGDRYAQTGVGYRIRGEEVLEIRGLGKFRWKQTLIAPGTRAELQLASPR